MRERTRRRFLTAGITVAGVAIAGCTDAGSDADDGTTQPGAEDGTDTGPTQNETRSDATDDQEAESDAEAGSEDDETTGTDGESPSEQEDDSGSDGPQEETEQEPLFPEYETTEVRAETPGGEELGSVTAAIAETSDEWSIGLSDTDSLPEDWGMLFVSGSTSDRTFWMKDMDFGLDIVFVDDEKRITGIHHAPAPGPDEDGTNQRYSGRGQYVFEVNYEWTVRHGVTEGDVLQFEL
jgi:uncharacterized membrane protein (UPF0127 family)